MGKLCEGKRMYWHWNICCVERWESRWEAFWVEEAAQKRHRCMDFRAVFLAWEWNERLDSMLHGLRWFIGKMSWKRRMLISWVVAVMHYNAIPKESSEIIELAKQVSCSWSRSLIFLPSPVPLIFLFFFGPYSVWQNDTIQILDKSCSSAKQKKKCS